MPEVAGQRTEYPDIPRIDAHSHGGIEVDKLARFLNLRGLLLERYGVDLAIWINLGDDEGPQALEERVASAQDLRALEASVEDRMLWALDDYSPHCGPGHAPDELQEWLDRGCIGYKIWYGPAHRVLKDDQEGIPTWTTRFTIRPSPKWKRSAWWARPYTSATPMVPTAIATSGYPIPWSSGVSSPPGGTCSSAIPICRW